MLDQQATAPLQQVHGEEIGAARHPHAAVIRHAYSVRGRPPDHRHRRPHPHVGEVQPCEPHAGGPRPTLRNPSRSPRTPQIAGGRRASSSPPYGFKPALRVLSSAARAGAMAPRVAASRVSSTGAGGDASSRASGVPVSGSVASLLAVTRLRSPVWGCVLRVSTQRGKLWTAMGVRDAILRLELDAKDERELRMISVLSLTGGGFRGLYTARLLERIEQRKGQPVGRCFDLVAGTSIGGILGLAVAFEIPMADVVRQFETHGHEIFPRRKRYGGVFRSRYDFHPVGALLDRLFPDGATLADAKHALVIPTLNLTLGRGQLLKTRHNPQWQRDHLLAVRDVAKATSAAPIYFPIAEVGNSLYSDGGLFANAPDLVALHEANIFFGAADQDVQMLSLGTMAEGVVTPHGINVRRGIASWLSLPSLPLIQTILSCQEQMALQIVSHRLQERHMRVDREPNAHIRDIVGLDKATDEAVKTLISSADASFEALDRMRLERFLLHTPKKWIV